MKQNKWMYIVLTGLLIGLYVITPNKAEAASKAPKGSQVAGITINGKTENQAIELINNEISVWQAKDDLQIEGEGERFSIPRNQVQFDAGKTMEEFNNQTKRKFSSFFLRPKNIHIPLIVHINEQEPTLKELLKREDIDGGQLIQDIETIASGLQDGDIAISYKDGHGVSMETIAEVDLDIPEDLTDDLHTAVERLDDHTIGAEESFAFLETAVAPEKLIGKKDEWDFLASAVYELFLQTNIDIAERHAQVEIPNDTKPGLDVHVDASTKKDFIVVNPDSHAYQMTFDITRNTLHAALKSTNNGTSYSFERTKEEVIKPRTLYRYNKHMATGEEKVVDTGKDGLRVQVERSLQGDDPEIISRDVYLAQPKIVMVSTIDKLKERRETEEKKKEPINQENLEQLNKEIEEVHTKIDHQQQEVGESPIEKDGPTLSKQLKEIKELQSDLNSRLMTMELAFDDMDENTKKDIKALKEKSESKEKELNKQIKTLEKQLKDKKSQGKAGVK